MKNIDKRNLHAIAAQFRSSAGAILSAHDKSKSRSVEKHKFDAEIEDNIADFKNTLGEKKFQ